MTKLVVQTMCEDKTDFFDLFEFRVARHDEVDYAVVYMDCVVTRDVDIDSRHLRKGDFYDQVVFSFKHADFKFIVWDKTNDPHWVPDAERSFSVSQSQLVGVFRA